MEEEINICYMKITIRRKEVLWIICLWWTVFFDRLDAQSEIIG